MLRFISRIRASGNFPGCQFVNRLDYFNRSPSFLFAFENATMQQVDDRMKIFGFRTQSRHTQGFISVTKWGSQLTFSQIVCCCSMHLVK